jgi:glycosyltransferase involved in cell wall biosynthesis
VAEDIRLSVALVTRNRPSSLERTLESLRAQEVRPYEIVLSDDSEDRFAGRVFQIAERFGCHYLRGPRCGLYANRNFAALACTGSHIRTMDDDHEFPPGHVAVCLAALREDPASVWIIGEYPPDQEQPGLPPSCPGQLTPRGYSTLPPDPQCTWAIADGASIYPRKIFDCGLRFVEDFKFGALYLEFGSRLYWLGYPIRFLPDTYVVHHFDIKTRSFNEPETEFAAQFFAALCHSLIYQPSAKNRLLCIGEMAKLVMLRRTPAARGAWRALVAYRAHARCLAAQACSLAVGQTQKQAASGPG